MKTGSLTDKVLALHDALVRVPHAFGGALALAYYAEPRATIDIDLNIFVGVDDVPVVQSAVQPLGVAFDDEVREVARRDGQARAFYDNTAVDFFFAYDPFHNAAAEAVRTVPFAGATIPILGPDHLTVCKVIFNRPKDWLDIDTMREMGTVLDTATVVRWVARIAGDDDPRFERIVAVLSGGRR